MWRDEGRTWPSIVLFVGSNVCCVLSFEGSQSCLDSFKAPGCLIHEQLHGLIHLEQTICEGEKYIHKTCVLVSPLSCHLIVTFLKQEYTFHSNNATS